MVSVTHAKFSKCINIRVCTELFCGGGGGGLQPDTLPSQFIPTAAEKLHATVMVEFLLERGWLLPEPAVGVRPT